MKIHPVVNVSIIVVYPLPVEKNREKKYEVGKILNKRDIRKKPKYLVR